MSVRIEYRLTGAGWSSCKLAIDDKEVTITASYLSDAFANLLKALIRILEGEEEATSSFDEEPGEYRWKFFRREPDKLCIRILSFPGLWSHEPDEAGEILFDVNCRLNSFAGAMLCTAQDLLSSHGEEGYLEKWGNDPFPIDEFHRLRKLLKHR